MLKPFGYRIDGGNKLNKENDMKLSTTTPTNLLLIKQPRWKDRVVLLAQYKIGVHNTIRFTDVPSMKQDYYISGVDVKKYPLSTNGKIACYEVPITALDYLERS